jgi:WD40 repeat protein
LIRLARGNAAVFVLGVGFCGYLLAADSTGAQSGDAGKKLLAELNASAFRLVWASRGTNQGANAELYVSKADGSEPVNITNTADQDERIPRVCPASGRIAFVTAACMSGKLKRDNRNGKLAFMDLDGKNREETEVESVCDKDWNPEGTKIAMNWPDRKTGGFRIYDVKTKKTETLAGDKVGILDIDWSHDGKLFIFGTRKELGYRYTLLTMTADGTGMRPFHVGGDGSPFCHPCWHPSAMTAAWNSQQGLLVGDYDASDGKSKNVHALVSFKDVGWEDPCPRWSPDGVYIAYISQPKRLHIVRVADSARAELAIPKGWKLEVWDYDWVAKAK